MNSSQSSGKHDGQGVQSSGVGRTAGYSEQAQGQFGFITILALLEASEHSHCEKDDGPTISGNLHQVF